MVQDSEGERIRVSESWSKTVKVLHFSGLREVKNNRDGDWIKFGHLDER